MHKRAGGGGYVVQPIHGRVQSLTLAPMTVNIFFFSACQSRPGRSEVFGKVRYMNAAGLKRKFKIDDYVAQV